jgi:predicted phosphodiesterase
MTKKKLTVPYKVIVLPDMHIPFHDRKALSAVEQYMADETWDEWLQLGDFLDLSCISHFSRHTPRKVEGHTIHAEYEAGNRVLERHQAIVRERNPKAKFTMLEGNHEGRVEKYLDEFPQLRNIIEVETALCLNKRNVKWVKCNSKGDAYKLGKAYFHHGLYTNEHHAKKMGSNFGGNVFYGHTHSVQEYSKVLWGANKSIVGASLGCLCEYEQDYIGKNPTSWQHAFGVFHFMQDGSFNHYVVRIHDGAFVAPNGKMYVG